MGMLKQDEIVSYLDFFHDGAVLGFSWDKDELIISMESAEIDPEELRHEINLSRYSSLAGKLHVNNVQKVRINGDTVERLVAKNSRGKIFNLEFTDDKLLLEIVWRQKGEEEDFQLIEVETNRIWWENLPHLIVE